MTLTFKPKMDDNTIARMFLRCNLLLHVPELTRTDEYSVGKLHTAGKTVMEKVFAKKLFDMMEGNMAHEREIIVNETERKAQISAFGSSFLEQTNT